MPPLSCALCELTIRLLSLVLMYLMDTPLTWPRFVIFRLATVRTQVTEVGRSGVRVEAYCSWAACEERSVALERASEHVAIAAGLTLLKIGVRIEAIGTRIGLRGHCVEISIMRFDTTGLTAELVAVLLKVS